VKLSDIEFLSTKTALFLGNHIMWIQIAMKTAYPTFVLKQASLVGLAVFMALCVQKPKCISNKIRFHKKGLYPRYVQSDGDV